MSVKAQITELLATLPQGVTLVAVSKFHPVEALREAYDAGQRIFGESRPQELVAKVAQLPADIEWHMIGHLQTNKVKMIAPFVSLIHSVDSERLVAEIDRQAAKHERVIDVLFEVHLAEDESKSGWNKEELLTFISSGALENYPNVRVRGLMTIGTLTDDIELNKAEFRTLRALFENLREGFGEAFDTVSMGMTSDYWEAIECGSTMVRIGSKIFGERDYSK
ncbi:MAG: YggS family pyridoxal phosphate-dependent enzyme [Tidjanibacter sp.]|nr:YggS family pyridoxal phosphate-dependent enzyme [Tidjanibacter sp.]